MRIYKLLIFSIVLSFSAQAQNQTTADSLKANQTKMHNDSLEAAKKTTTVAVSQTAPQKRDTRPMSERIFFDISTSFWITPSSSFFQFFPSVGYRFPKTFSVGAGPVYVYNHDRLTQVNLTGWGGSVYGTAHLTSWFYAYTEYQGISNQYVSGIDLSNNNVTKSSEYVDSWFLSLGINIRIGRRHGINMQALYDVLYDKGISPYYSAWTYRVGFGF